MAKVLILLETGTPVHSIQEINEKVAAITQRVSEAEWNGNYRNFYQDIADSLGARLTVIDYNDKLYLIYDWTDTKGAVTQDYIEKLYKGVYN